MGRFTTLDPIGLLGGDHLYMYAPNPTAWVDALGLAKCKKNKPKKKNPEQIIHTGSYEQARNMALSKIGKLMPGSRTSHIGKMGVMAGKIVGFKGKNLKGETVMYRLDYDPIKGPHINVNIGRGKCSDNYAITFPGEEKDIKSLLKSLQK